MTFQVWSELNLLENNFTCLILVLHLISYSCINSSWTTRVQTKQLGYIYYMLIFFRIMRWLSYPRREGTQWILYFLEAINHRFNLKINNNVKYLIICWWVDLFINILNKEKTYASSRINSQNIERQDHW